MLVMLGRGVLNWPRFERVGDRYGTVVLYTDATQAELVSPSKAYDGCNGRLFATVEATRPSYHVGDNERKIKPSIPSVGEKVLLGEGYLFFGHVHEPKAVGLRPADERDEAWLDPMALYRVHYQTVTLTFESL